MKFVERRKFVIKFFFFTIGLITGSLHLNKIAAARETDIKEREPKPSNSETKQKNGLSAEAKKILEQNGTEPAFSSHLLYEDRKGTYHCAKCDNLIFTSEMKYDSGTGWPSFYDHVEGSLSKRLDFKLLFPRTEYHCRNCGGHQGHLFKDGPAPTFLRWCNNGLALTFKPAK